MWIRRLAALAVAIALVAGALVVRQRIDRSGSSTGTSPTTAAGGTPGSTAPPATPATLTLVCIPELEAACRSAAAATTKPKVTVRVEQAGTTRTALTAADDPSATLSAWVTLSPWAALTDASRGRAVPPRPGAFGTAAPLGASPISLAVKADRFDALAALCGGTLTWTCVGDNAGKPWSALGGPASWGSLYPAHADPTASAVGLAALAGIVVQRIGNSTFTATELDGTDPAFDSWITSFERSIPRSAFDTNQGTPLQQLLAEPRYSVVAATKAEVGHVPAARAGAVRGVEPAPVVLAEAVVVPAAGVAIPADLVQALSGAVQDLGWQPPSGAPTNAPTAVTMEALQQAWLRWR